MSGLPWRAPPPPVQLAGVSDLTVLTPMRQGLIPGVWDTIAWHERFERVLRLLDSLRRLSREAATAESPYFDLVGRWQIVHFFRFAAVPAERLGGGPPQILLNVTFDGVWEPYMRVIWGPIGPLLDLIFCHAETYRLAHTHGFDDYMAWVRGNEVRPGFFYADGGLQIGDRTLTVHDRSWLAQAEALRRGGQDPVAIDRAIVQRHLMAPPPKRRLLAMADELADPSTPPQRKAELSTQLRIALSTGLRVLRAFALMRPTFDAVAGSTVLLRAAQALLEEFHDFVAAGGFARAPWSALASAHAEALAWFGQTREQPQRPARVPALPDPRAEVQAGVLSPHPGSHGLMLLARVRAGADALQAWRNRLAAAAANLDALLPGHGDVTWTLGFTPQGLLAHGVPGDELDTVFPLDFRQGMEARAPAIGDLGTNHPQQWQLPLRNWAPATGSLPARIDPAATTRIALGEIHVAIVLRASPAVGETPPAPDQPLARLAAAASALEGHGLQILSAQPLARQDDGHGENRRSVGHFGFVDPKSQPEPGAATTAGAQWWSDGVPWGEVLMGHANPHRVDEAWPIAPNPLLDNGSFLVVRKLRQFVGRWNTVDQLTDDDRERLMGRRRDGRALLPTGAGGDNDFRYEAVHDAAGKPLYAGDPDRRAMPVRLACAPGQPAHRSAARHAHRTRRGAGAADPAARHLLRSVLGRESGGRRRPGPDVHGLQRPHRRPVRDGAALAFGRQFQRRAVGPRRPDLRRRAPGHGRSLRELGGRSRSGPAPAARAGAVRRAAVGPVPFRALAPGLEHAGPACRAGRRAGHPGDPAAGRCAAARVEGTARNRPGAAPPGRVARDPRPRRCARGRPLRPAGRGGRARAGRAARRRPALLRPGLRRAHDREPGPGLPGGGPARARPPGARGECGRRRVSAGRGLPPGAWCRHPGPGEDDPGGPGRSILARLGAGGPGGPGRSGRRRLVCAALRPARRHRDVGLPGLSAAVAGRGALPDAPAADRALRVSAPRRAGGGAAGPGGGAGRARRRRGGRRPLADERIAAAAGRGDPRHRRCPARGKAADRARRALGPNAGRRSAGPAGHGDRAHHQAAADLGRARPAVGSAARAAGLDEGAARQRRHRAEPAAPRADAADAARPGARPHLAPHRPGAEARRRARRGRAHGGAEACAPRRPTNARR